MRVEYKCMSMGCSVGIHTGTIWKPDPQVKARYTQESDYEIAVKLGLTADPLPLAMRCNAGPGGLTERNVHFALVAFDDRPGVLAVHNWSELKVVEP